MNNYFLVLRRNPDFARLWSAQAVSLIGDWFNTIVLSGLVAEYSNGSGLAISGLLLARFLPPLLISPIAGVLLDRFSRKRLLIASDLVRVVVVLLFLLADSPDRLWLIYVLTVLQFGVSTIFEPGRSALLPAVVAREDLVRANIIGSMTWSVMLAVGGALGGIITGLFGPAIALVIDALTFLLSALLILPIRPQVVEAADATPAPAHTLSWRDFQEGIRYALQRPAVAAVLLVKFGGNFGSADTVIIVYATSLFVLGENGAWSLGVLWASFGLGAIAGPIVFNRFNDGTVRTMRRLIAIAYAVITVGWLVLGLAPSLAVAALGLFVRAMGSNIYWTYSSVILQETVSNRFLGRIFSIDMAGFQAAVVISVLLTGLALEQFGESSIRLIVFITLAASLIPLTAWVLTVGRLERRELVAAGD